MKAVAVAAFIIVISVLVLQLAAAPLPHVSECRVCFHCHITDAAQEHAGTNNTDKSGAQVQIVQHSRRTLAESLESTAVQEASGRGSTSLLQMPETTPNASEWFRQENFRPASRSRNKHLPKCLECWGCKHNLTLLTTGTKFLNTTYTYEPGTTDSWNFKASTNVTPSGKAVVKVYCVPLQKPGGGKARCRNPKEIMAIMRLVLAMGKVAHDCGLEDLLPRVWVAPVSGVIPGVGYHINWWGLWMELVDGISIEKLVQTWSEPRTPNAVILDLLSLKLNKTSVVRAAIFDLLTSQCDRNPANIMIQVDGNIKLIDNDRSLMHRDRNCVIDSLLLPTTQRGAVRAMSWPFVKKTEGAALIDKQGPVNPEVLLDYRCYVGGKGAGGVAQATQGPEPVTGLLGTNYPPGIKQCLKRISGMSADEVHEYFGLPERRLAHILRTRAADMLAKGFEWTAKYGKPLDRSPFRYRPQPPCCRMDEDPASRQLRCAHPWQPKWELPYGDPETGGKWSEKYPDIGSYKGGDFGDLEEFRRKGAAALAGPADGR